MNRIRLAMLCLLLALPAGCARSRTRPDRASGARTFVYQSPDGYRFVARVEGERVWLFLPERTLWLPHVRAASGAKYNDGQTTFWSHGQQALLEYDGRVRTDCANQPAQAVWEHAKLNGMDFRAVGQEPAWVLEIWPDRIVLVADYGQTRFDFPKPEPQSQRDPPRTIYAATQNGHILQVILEPRETHDTMSGERYETTVTVRIDGRELRGGGRPLH
jgi:membrane-bound inhibitor of C-type lysozyme